MKLSRWARLWIVAVALASCAPESLKPRVSDDRAADLSLACKRFLATVRKGWEVQTADLVERHERDAIDRMREACAALERDLFEGGE